MVIFHVTNSGMMMTYDSTWEPGYAIWRLDYPKHGLFFAIFLILQLAGYQKFNTLLLNMAHRNSWFTQQKMVIFHSYVNVYHWLLLSPFRANDWSSPIFENFLAWNRLTQGWFSQLSVFSISFEDLAAKTWRLNDKTRALFPDSTWTTSSSTKDLNHAASLTMFLPFGVLISIEIGHSWRKRRIQREHHLWLFFQKATCKYRRAMLLA